MRAYESPAAAAADGMRLAEAMTLKFAVSGLDRGGGKSVIAVPALPTGADRRDLLHAYGRFLKGLHGAYSCAPDMNTGPDDMDVIAEACEHVFCRTEARGGSGDTAPDTARGLLHGIRACARHRFGSDSLSGRTVVVQGAGAVGARLARLLAAEEARVLVADVDPARIADLAGAAEPVPADEALLAPCDILAPCAAGGVLTVASVDRLRCAIVAGAANNQLAAPDVAGRLRERGILYAPDFVINAGGVLHGAGIELLGWAPEELDRRLAGIGDVLLQVFADADARGIDTDTAARELAARRLAGAGEPQ
jgi:leucine dehydrogenase